MVIIVVFLLAVLFVAAVWGREAAQRLFKGGMKVAGVLFGIVAFIVILLAINLQPPKQADIDQSLAAGQSSAYYVPLDPPSSDSGAVRQRPESVNVAPSNMYNGDLGNPKIGIGLAMPQLAKRCALRFAQRLWGICSKRGRGHYCVERWHPGR